LERYAGPVRRFVDDVVIPTVMVGAIVAGDIAAPEAIPVTVPALVANGARLVTVAGRAAVAMGATEIYKELTSFFKKSTGNGGKSGGNGTGQRIFEE
jgi:hypothetical protein